jgi:hypothetical protein
MFGAKAHLRRCAALVSIADVQARPATRVAIRSISIGFGNFIGIVGGWNGVKTFLAVTNTFRKKYRVSNS